MYSTVRYFRGIMALFSESEIDFLHFLQGMDLTSDKQIV